MIQRLKLTEALARSINELEAAIKTATARRDLVLATVLQMNDIEEGMVVKVTEDFYLEVEVEEGDDGVFD